VNITEIAIDDLSLSDDLRRSGSAKQFEDRLRASIEEIGLVEPLKVATLPMGDGYLVVDGALRLRAIRQIRQSDPTRFNSVPTYITDYAKRFEIRYQTDIYQDLLPSQLASLVEHLHKTESIKKTDIARYIGVSPTTLRNYTGLWRLLQRGGLFARIVDLMDVAVLPSSNPYAWLRLTDTGLRHVIEKKMATEEISAEIWLEHATIAARQGHGTRFTTGYVETVTGDLADELYREASETRDIKRDLGLRRSSSTTIALTDRPSAPRPDRSKALRRLGRVSKNTTDPVLRAAALAFEDYLR